MPGPLDLLGGFVLDIGRPWGAVATGVQRQDAVAVLQQDGGPRLHWLERPKGMSKSTDAACLSMCWALTQAGPGDEGIIVSSDEEQSNRLLNRARTVVRRTLPLQGHVKVEARRIVNTHTGAFVSALAADVSGSEGILSPWVVVDELPRWRSTQGAKDLWTSIFSGVPKVPGAKLIVLGHAGDPSHWAFKIRERARTSPQWRFASVPGPTPWLDPGDLDEQQAILLPSQWAQRYLNRWTAGEDRLTTRDDVEACLGDYEVLDPQPGRRYVTALDVGLTNDRTVATVAHRDGDRIIVDRQQHWQGSPAQPVDLGAVEGWLAETLRAYPGRLVADPWQAAHLCQRLRARGQSVTEFTFSSQSVGRLAVVLFRLLRARQLLLPADAALADELANARLRQTAPGVYRIDHDSGSHDDRVISLALAAHHLTTTGTDAPASWGGQAAARANATSGLAAAEQARHTPNPWRTASPTAPVG